MQKVLYYQCMLKTSEFTFMVLAREPVLVLIFENKRWGNRGENIHYIWELSKTLFEFSQKSALFCIPDHMFQHIMSLLCHLTIHLFTIQLIFFHLLLTAPEKHQSCSSPNFCTWCNDRICWQEDQVSWNR